MQSTKRLYVLYHEVRPGGSAYSYVMDTEGFNDHCSLYARLQSDPLAQPRPEITFDDGHRSNYEHALPVLQAHGLTAQFFITVGWTEQKQDYMSWLELTALHNAGQEIGAHGWSHTLLTQCNAAELKSELERPRLTLEDKLGTSIVTMSLPGGRYNKRVLAACKDAGYERVYTSVPSATPDLHEYTAGRLNIRGDMKVDWIEGLFVEDSKTLAKLETGYKLKAAAKGLLGDSLYAKLWAIVNQQESQDDLG